MERLEFSALIADHVTDHRVADATQDRSRDLQRNKRIQCEYHPSSTFGETELHRLWVVEGRIISEKRSITE
jgi:hypothetical protein